MVMGAKQIIMLPEIGSIFHLPIPGCCFWRKTFIVSVRRMVGGWLCNLEVGNGE